MTSKPPQCLAIEEDLLAAATGDAGATADRRVREHVGICAGCRQEHARYRELDAAVTGLRGAASPGADLAGARARLDARLADLRARVVLWAVVPSPLGPILLARSEQGVSLVEYVTGAGRAAAGRLARAAGLEAIEDGAELEALHGELLEYLAGRRARLGWPLDLRLARSGFHRAVLEATAAVPYGAVTSYASIAAGIGRPAATRAVAQALRWNPLPIVVPCHRIVGSTGALTGYAGRRIGLKQRLLAVEGVRTVRVAREPRVAREAMYVRDGDDREYCVPTCGSRASRTLARLTLFASRECAERTGLVPCTACRPDLHPIAS